MSKMILVTGNTFPIKDQLKALGGKWDAAEKVWRIPESKVEEAKNLVRQKEQRRKLPTWDDEVTEYGSEYDEYEFGAPWNS